MQRVIYALLLCTFFPSSLAAQSAPPATSMPRDYQGVQVHIDGVWVTPVPNAPFVAVVEIVSHEKLPDGSEHVVKTVNHIARSSSGLIRNERRKLVPSAFPGEPRLLSAHLYDPNTRINTYFDPLTHIARQTVLASAPRVPANERPPEQQRVAPDVKVSDLGSKPFNGVELQGTRKTRVIPADRSGTGQPVTITDEYWYSPELSVYLVIRHDDPRTGEQLVAVTDIQRQEPPADLMTVPPEYKIVDETPPHPAVQALPAAR